MMSFPRTALWLPAVWLVAIAPARADIPDETIQQAVDRGVAALRNRQANDGHFGGYGSGSTSLAALTLLECGVGPEEECIRKAAEVVRGECPDLNRVYHLSLAIMFLDRLGDPRDVPLIQAMTVRLLEGQFAEGGWSYTTPDVDSKESQRLRTEAEKHPELKTKPDGTKPAAPPLDPDLVERIRRIENRRGPAQGRIGDGQTTTTGIDNSNTQFAILGLWVARRHGLPVDDALRRAERYFRASHIQGAWPYRPNNETTGQPAMTCAGLLGLAIGAGVSREAKMRTTPEGKGGQPSGPPPALRDPLKDMLVQAALNYVGNEVARAAVTGLDFTGPGRDFYFLWSVERTGVAYNLNLMGGRNWYQLGCGLLLRYQRADGLWAGRYAPEIDSCFALLFLRKANLAHDLTTALRNKPSQATLKAGGGDPPAAPAAEPSAADRLAGDLKTASPARQEKILEELRDHKGGEYTDALARVIPQLTGEVQRKARDALAERMARMTAATLRTHLRSADAELRRASALACAMKEDKSLIPDLIATLDDSDGWVVRAAAVALKMLTGQNFGPSAHATDAERAKAVAAWKAWWKRQNGL
jgi:hypothetical protein